MISPLLRKRIALRVASQLQCAAMDTPTRFASFAEFYPYYLSEHSNRTCRRLHFIGSTLGGAWAVSGLLGTVGIGKGGPGRILSGLAIGYAFAWVGHFFFEKNRPATFKYPRYSFIGDWAMWRDIVTGKIPF